MAKLVRIIHLEDDSNDVELVKSVLEAADIRYQIAHVKSSIDFEKLLTSGDFDLILADYHLPSYDGMSALRTARKLYPDIPFIFVSGTIGEDAAIDALTQGATDYVPKLRLSRLVPAIHRALNEADNVKERRMAEIGLRESGERFRAVADSAAEGVILANSKEAVIYWNQSAEKIFGYSEMDILGQKISLLFPAGLDLDNTGKRGKRTSALVTRPTSRLVELIGRKKSGEKFPIELSISSWMTHEGRFYSALVRDISQRKKTEESLRLQSAALEAAANGIMITTIDGTITWVNTAFTRLTGFQSDDVIGENPRVLSSGKQNQAFYKDLWDTILAGKVWKHELVNKQADGALYWEELTISPVYQEPGKISHFVAIKQDISERKHHEQERMAIITVADAMRTVSTRAELLQTFLVQINELFDANGSFLAIPDKTNGGSFVEIGYGPSGERFSHLKNPPGKGISNMVIDSGRPILNNDIKNDPNFLYPEYLGEARAAVCIPLIAHEEVLGALWMVRNEPICEDDVNLLTAISNLTASSLHRVTLLEQTEHHLHQMASLHQIDIAISSILDLHVILDVLLNNAINQLGMDAASVLILNPQTFLLEYADGIGFITHGIEKTKIHIGQGRAGMAIANRKIISSNDLSVSTDSFSQRELYEQEKFVSHHVAPLIVKGEIKGVLELFSRHRFEPSEEWFDYFETLATQAAIAIDHMTLFNDLQNSNTEVLAAYDATIEGWSHAMDLRDRETEGHTQRVVAMVLHLAAKLGIKGNDLINIRRGSLLHDIGKIGIPDSILFKPDQLTEAEWKIMRCHPLYAYEMLAPIAYLKDALVIPYLHHEKWDGSGYPNGLKGDQIPLPARIFAIVDVWDALTSNRPYRQAWKSDKTLEYIRSQSGKHFDPKVVTAFVDMLISENISF